jgi:outer membrane receptor protein involved in Fe transport
MLTVGLEHRKEGNANSNVYETYPITTANTFDTTYFGKSQSINSAYAEAEVPIITAKNSLPLLHELDLQLAARSEDYSVGTGTSYSRFYPNRTPPTTSYGGTTVNGQPYHSTTKYTSTNPTAGLKYVPVDGVTLRASYGTAFLPPTYNQLLNNPVPSTSLTTITDPQTGQRYGVQTVQNLNSDLKPQNSKDWDLGAIWEPKAEILKGLRFDLEFFQIKEFSVISSPPGGAQFIVTNAATYANRITRSSTTGIITLVDTSSVNLYELETTGWDLSADYRKPTSYGTFELYALGTIQEHYKQQTSVTGPLLDYVGYVAEGGPAKTKANATLTWERGHWQLGWTTEFFDGYKQYGAPGGPAGTFTKYTLAQGGYTIPSQLVHNLFASYSFGKRKTGSRVGDKLASDWTIQAGIKNVFNTLPPFDAYYSPYYYSPYGDPRLRDLWVSIKKEF